MAQTSHHKFQYMNEPKSMINPIRLDSSTSRDTQIVLFGEIMSECQHIECIYSIKKDGNQYAILGAAVQLGL